MEWKKCKIGDTGVIITGKTPKTSIKENYGGDIPFLSPSDDMSNKTAPLTSKTLTSIGLSEVRNCLIPKGSICVSCIGSDLGKVVQADRPLVTNQQINSIIPKSDVNSDFLYYLMCIIGKELNFIGKTSTAVPIINKSMFSNWDIKIPVHYNDQLRIASILSSLDAKIENNNKINANLEAQAQALFKSWFVDFEPFQNGEFEDSELGRIPKGWKVGIINDLCCFESGFAFKSSAYKSEGIYRLVTIKNVQDGYLDVTGTVSIDKIPTRLPNYCLLKIGDILLSLTGNVGRCCIVDDKNLLLNQRVAKIKPKIDNNWGYIYTMFRCSIIKERIISIARGTAQANLSPVETSKLKIIIPGKSEIDRFSFIVNSYYKTLINNMIENRWLSNLRDTLLPKLMSGEIEV